MRCCRARACASRSAVQSLCSRYTVLPSCSAARALSSLFPAPAKTHDGPWGPTGPRRQLTSSTTTSPSPSRFADSTATKSDESPSTLPNELRLLMRHIGSSVVVCTAHAHAGSQSSSPASVLPVGLAMSSFTSLSLYPSPVISFNIAMPSRTEAAISRARHFMIHVLSADAHGARVVNAFRSGNADSAKITRALQAARCQVTWPQKEKEAPEALPLGAHQPYLHGPGVLFVLRCRLLEEPLRGLVAVRDHVIVLGEVLEIIRSEAEDLDSSGIPRVGLAYANGRFCRLADGDIHT